VRSRIKLDFQHPTVDVYLTAEHNLLFHGELYEVPKPALGSRILQVLEMVELVELWDSRGEVVGHFSAGCAVVSRSRGVCSTHRGGGRVLENGLVRRERDPGCDRYQRARGEA